MALIDCPECGNAVSTEARACPSCGGKVPTARPAAAVVSYGEGRPRSVSLLLIIGVLLVPYVFAWFLLGKGYSQRARVVGLGWMTLIVGLAITSGMSTRPGSPAVAAAETAAPPKEEIKADNPNAVAPLVVGMSLKAAARSPDSLIIEHATANPSRTFVCVLYRAQNGFGGMNRSHVVFTKAGGDPSARAWNRKCVTDGLQNVTNEVKSGAGMNL